MGKKSRNTITGEINEINKNYVDSMKLELNTLLHNMIIEMKNVQNENIESDEKISTMIRFG